jgi:integrase/recombinase XerD
MSASVKIIHYKTRQKKSGKFPVKLRVINNRDHKDYKTGIDLTEDEFEGATNTNPKKQFRVIASELNTIREKANQTIKSIPHFTYNKFESLFFDFHKDASDIFPFFEDYIKQLTEEDRIKTAVAYRTAMNALKNYHPKKLHLYDITPSFLSNFQKANEKKGKSPTTTGIYIRSLRTIYNLCINKGIIKKDENYPFGRGKYVIPAGRNIKKALSLSEIGKIAKYKAIAGSFPDRARDFWMLSYLLGGINFKDLLLLKHKNIDKDMLRYVREKTKKTTQGNQFTISAFIPDEAREIIDKWKDETKTKDDYLFPFIKDTDNPKTKYATVEQFIQNTNKNLKRICEELGIEKNVTTYYSRHSAATVLKRSGASISQIQEVLGHSSPIITQKYLDSFEDETKRELAKALNNF